jgi:hypothetical protein
MKQACKICPPRVTYDEPMAAQIKEEEYYGSCTYACQFVGRSIENFQGDRTKQEMLVSFAIAAHINAW